MEAAVVVERVKQAAAGKRLDEARRLSHEATVAWRRTHAQNPLEHATALQELGNALMSVSLPGEAEPLLREVLALRVGALSADHLDVARAHADLAKCTFTRGDLRTARAHQETAIEIRRAHALYDDAARPRVSEDFYSLGYICWKLEDFVAALGAWQEQLRLLQAAPEVDHGRVAWCLSDLGEMGRQLGDYELAEDYFKRGIRESAEYLQRDRFHAVYLNNLGLLYWDEERLDEAEGLLEEALRISAADPKTAPLRLVRAHENLGVLARDQNRMDDGERKLLYALELGKSTLEAGNPALVTVLDALGILYSRLARWDEAMLSWNEALTILRQHTFPQETYQAKILYNIGIGHSARGEAALAYTTFQQVRTMRERLLDVRHPELGVALIALARAAVDLKSSVEAESLLSRAMPIVENNPAWPLAQAEAYALRAEIRMSSGRAEAARSDMQRAIAIVEELRPRRGGSDENRARFLSGYLDYYATMIQWLVDAGRSEQALAYAEAAKGRVLREQLRSNRVDLRRGIPPEQLQPVESRERDARARIVRAQQGLHDLGASASQRDSNAVMARETLQKQLAEAVDDFRQANEEIKRISPIWKNLLRAEPTLPPIAELQGRLLPHNSFMLIYQIGAASSHLFVVPPHPGQLECHRLAVPRRTVSSGKREGPEVDGGAVTSAWLGRVIGDGGLHSEGLMAKLRAIKPAGTAAEAEKDKDASLRRESLHTLWQALMPPEVWQQVKMAAEIILVPDAALHLVPFEALIEKVGTSESTTGYWLDVGPPIRYANSILTLLDQTATLGSATRPAQGRSILTVSDPLFDPDDVALRVAVLSAALQPSLRGAFTPLPGTRIESDAIRRYFDQEEVVLLQGSQATEARLKQEAPRAGILHLATHGIVGEDRNGAVAALVLAPPPHGEPAVDDGLLHLFEIYDIPLHCDLAVLSACGTHVGTQIHGEGVFALSRGFLAAGSERVVASLWPVSDASTAFLISEFFRALAAARSGGVNSEVSYASLLHAAKRSVRAHREWAAPFHWGAFVISGVR